MRIGEDSLKFFPAGVAAELIDGQYLREAGRLWVPNILHPAEEGGRRNSQQGGGGGKILPGFQ